MYAETTILSLKVFYSSFRKVGIELTSSFCLIKMGLLKTFPGEQDEEVEKIRGRA